MKKQEFLNLLEDLFEFDHGTLTETDQLDQIPEWNSLAALGFIALMDEHFNVIVAPKDLAACKTIGNLAALAGDAIQ